MSTRCGGRLATFLTVLGILCTLHPARATGDGTTIAYLRLDATNLSAVPAKVAAALAVNASLVLSNIVVFGDGHSEMHLWIVGDNGQALMGQLSGWILSGSAKIAGAEIFQCEVVYAAAPTPAPPPTPSSSTTAAPGGDSIPTLTPDEKQPVSNGVILGAAIGAAIGVFVISFAFSKAYIRWYEWKQRSLYSSASADDASGHGEGRAEGEELSGVPRQQQGSAVGEHDSDDDNGGAVRVGLATKTTTATTSQLAIPPEDAMLIPPRRISRAFERLAADTEATGPPQNGGHSGGVNGGHHSIGRDGRKKRTIVDGSGQLPLRAVRSNPSSTPSRPLAPSPRDGFSVSLGGLFAPPAADEEDKPAGVAVVLSPRGNGGEVATAPPGDEEISRAQRITIAFDDAEQDTQQFSDPEQ